LIGLYLYQRHHMGVAGLVGFALNLLGLTGLFAIEITTHAIFPYLTSATRDELLAGPTRAYFLAIALTFLTGVVVFGIASLRTRMLPAPALGLYLLGFVPAALRGIVPEAVYLAGLGVGSVAVLWLSVALVRSADRITPGTLPAPTAVR
jgi:hypothetical protein